MPSSAARPVPRPSTKIGTALHTRYSPASGAHALAPDIGFLPVLTGINPDGLAIDTSGNVFYTDPWLNVVKEIAPNGTVTQVGSGFNGPWGLAVTNGGTVYVGDFGSHRLMKVTPPFTGPMHGTVTTVATLGDPTAVVLSGGNVYVADDNQIKEVAANGTTTPIGPLLGNLIEGLAVDPAGNFYATQTAFPTGYVTRIAPNGMTTNLSFSFVIPWGITYHAGALYVADRGAGIKRMALNGATTTFANTPQSPFGVAFDSAGDAYYSSESATLGQGGVYKVLDCPQLCLRFFVKNGGSQASRPNSVRVKLRNASNIVTSWGPYDVAASGPSCASVTGGHECYVSINVLAGSYLATFATYNSTNGSGPALSADEGAVVTSPSTVGIDLYNDPPATAQLQELPGYPPYASIAKCDTAVRRAVVVGVDAAGDDVLGVGAPLQTLTSNSSSLTAASALPYAINAFTLAPHTTSAATTVTLTALASSTVQHTYTSVLQGGTALCGVLTEFHLSDLPLGIVKGPDGAMWAIEYNSKIARVTYGGSVTEYASGLPAKSGGRYASIAVGADGALWYVTDTANSVGRITTSGAHTVYTIPTISAAPVGITAGPDNALWFTESASESSTSANSIAKITTSGTFTEYPINTPNARADFIAAGPDQRLWFAEEDAEAIGAVTTSGTFSQYVLPLTHYPSPIGITAGPDNALWFTEAGFTGGYSKIGRISTTGTIAEYPFSTSDSPIYIAAGPDGALWFLSGDGNLHRITTSGTFSQIVTGPLAAFAGIASGPNGSLWYGSGQSSIVRMQ